MVGVTVNGDPFELEDASTVRDAVVAAGLQPQRVAVARNGEVVPRRSWDAETLREGDRLEVVAAVQGG